MVAVLLKSFKKMSEFIGGEVGEQTRYPQFGSCGIEIVKILGIGENLLGRRWWVGSAHGAKHYAFRCPLT